MPTDSDTKPPKKTTGKSRVTNGSAVLPGVDGRGVWARRFKDLMELHTADLGGPASEAQKSIVRRVSALEVELERMELRFATAGEATERDLDLYQRTSNTLRRHLETLGIEAKVVVGDQPVVKWRDLLETRFGVTIDQGLL